MKKIKTPLKDRNVYAIAAWERSGAGKHKSKKEYDRKRDKSVKED